MPAPQATPALEAMRRVWGDAPFELLLGVHAHHALGGRPRDGLDDGREAHHLRRLGDVC